MNILEILWIAVTLFLIGVTFRLLNNQEDNLGGFIFLQLTNILLLFWYYIDILTTPLW